MRVDADVVVIGDELAGVVAVEVARHLPDLASLRVQQVGVHRDCASTSSVRVHQACPLDRVHIHRDAAWPLAGECLADFRGELAGRRVVDQVAQLPR